MKVLSVLWKPIRKGFKYVWELVEFPLVCLILLFLFVTCMLIASNGYRKDHGEYPKPIELGLEDAVKSSEVLYHGHEYIVCTYTTSKGAGISTVHDQNCKTCHGGKKGEKLATVD